MEFLINYKIKPKCSIENSKPGLYLQWAGACFWIMKGRQKIDNSIKYLTSYDNLLIPYSFAGWVAMYDSSDYYGNEVLTSDEVVLGSYVHKDSGHIIEVKGMSKINSNGNFCLIIDSYLHDSFKKMNHIRKSKTTLKIPNEVAKGLFNYYKILK